MSPSLVVKVLTVRRSFSPIEGFVVVSGPMRSGASSLTSCEEDMVDDVVAKMALVCESLPVVNVS